MLYFNLTETPHKKMLLLSSLKSITLTHYENTVFFIMLISSPPSKSNDCHLMSNFETGNQIEGLSSLFALSIFTSLFLTVPLFLSFFFFAEEGEQRHKEVAPKKQNNNKKTHARRKVHSKCVKQSPWWNVIVFYCDRTISLPITLFNSYFWHETENTLQYEVWACINSVLSPFFQ